MLPCAQPPGWEAESHVAVGHTPLSSPPLRQPEPSLQGRLAAVEARNTLILSVPAHRALPHQPGEPQSHSTASCGHRASKGAHCSTDTAMGRDSTESRPVAAWDTAATVAEIPALISSQQQNQTPLSNPKQGKATLIYFLGSQVSRITWGEACKKNSLLVLAWNMVPISLGAQSSSSAVLGQVWSTARTYLLPPRNGTSVLLPHTPAQPR